MNNNMNDKELTVKKIEKLSFDKKAMKGFKCFSVATCAFAIWAGAVLAPVSLGGTIAIWAYVAIFKKTAYNYSRDKVDELKEQIYKEKSKITYNEYKMYHKQPKVIKKAKKLYNSVRYRNRRGFASSSQTSNTRNY